MTEPIRPAAAQTFGRKNWIWVPTGGIASIQAPTVAELTAVSILDITRIAFADSTRPTPNTNTVDQERRYGDTVLFQFIGTTTFGAGTVHYAFDPQGAPASDGVKAYEKFTAGGSSGFFVDRLAVARAVAITAGQFVDVWPATVGPSFPSPAGDGESQEAGMVATFVVTSDPAIKVAVAA